MLIYGAAAYLVRTYAHPDSRVRTRTFWLVLLIAVGAVAVSFYLGFHWPTDLVGGLLAGGLFLRLLVEADRALARRSTQTGSRVPRSSASTMR